MTVSASVVPQITGSLSLVPQMTVSFQAKWFAKTTSPAATRLPQIID